MHNNCYFLAYRQHSSAPVNFDRPATGLVMKAKRFLYGKPVSDPQAACEIMDERLHCAPYERLLVAEVFEPREKHLAMLLHRRHVRETMQFEQIMKNILNGSCKPIGYSAK